MVIVISLTEMALTWYDVRHEKTFFLTVGVLGGAIWGASAKVVDVSRVDPHYFETADGRTFVPVGVNLVSGVQRGNEASLRRYEGWLEKFATPTISGIISRALPRRLKAWIPPPNTSGRSAPRRPVCASMAFADRRLP